MWTGAVLLVLYLIIGVGLYAVGSWQKKNSLKLVGKVMLMIPAVLSLGVVGGAVLMST